MDIETKEKKRSSAKFNAFDVVIIVVLLLAIIIPIVLTIRSGMEKSKEPVVAKEMLYMTVKIDVFDPATVGNIEINQKVFDNATGIYIGDLRTKSLIPCLNYAEVQPGKETLPETNPEEEIPEVETEPETEPETELETEIETEIETKPETKKPLIEILPDENGRYYLILTIKVDAVYNDGEGYTVNGERLAVGKTFDVRLPHFEATGICTGLSII